MSNSKEDKKPKEIKKNKAPIVVALRNRFFFMLYRYSILVFLFSLISLVSTFLMFIFIVRMPVPPQYVPINEDGSYIKLTPVDDCSSKSEGEVKKFAKDAINVLYKYDYINYKEELQDGAQYFTGQGWNEYLDSLTKSDTLLAVTENKWIVTVNFEEAPEITKTPYVDDADQSCTWEVKVPVDISYIGKTSTKQKGEVYARISRVSVLKNPEGLGIKRLVFFPKQ